MLQFVRRLRKSLKKRSMVLYGLYDLARDGDLSWLVRFARHRAKYTLRALHSGVQMNRNEDGDIYNFRRNIHRIEKGLSCKRLKDTFAENFILETVNYLSRNKQSGTFDPNTIAWGEAVLSKYFKTCRHTHQIAQSYRLYQSLKPENSQPTWNPYFEKCRPEVAVKYEALYQLALRRRSVRHYLDRTVEFDVVKKAMRVAALSPSACNRQPFKFLFYNDKNFVRKIAEIPGGFVGYELPSIVIAIGSYRAYFDERDANNPIIDTSLAIMTFLFALETLGLSSVCINLPSLPDRDVRIRQLIRLEEDEFIIMLIGIGYPDPEGKIPYSAKKDINQLIACNERIKK